MGRLRSAVRTAAATGVNFSGCPSVHNSRARSSLPPRASHHPDASLNLSTGLQAAILVYLTSVVDARQTQVQANDGSLARKPITDVAITTAMFLPGAFVLAVLTFVASEFWFKRWTGASRSQKVANVVQASAHLLAAFAYQVSVQQMSAVLVRPHHVPCTSVHLSIMAPRGCRRLHRPALLRACIVARDSEGIQTVSAAAVWPEARSSHHRPPCLQTGSPRPSYLSSCKHGLPLFDEEGGTNVMPDDCTGSHIKDELKSFPSGHASAAALVLLYGLFYLNHAAHQRVSRPLLAPTTWRAAALSDLGWGGLLCYNWIIFAAVRVPCCPRADEPQWSFMFGSSSRPAANAAASCYRWLSVAILRPTYRPL